MNKYIKMRPCLGEGDRDISIHPIFCTGYPTEAHREPGSYPRGLKAQGRGIHPGKCITTIFFFSLNFWTFVYIYVRTCFNFHSHVILSTAIISISYLKPKSSNNLRRFLLVHPERKTVLGTFHNANTFGFFPRSTPPLKVVWFYITLQIS